jgi:DNA-binding NtrC family response regulator
MVLEHSWPGNIRELENVIERAITLSTSPVISATEFRSIFNLGHIQSTSDDAVQASVQSDLHGAEREIIIRALRESEGNQTQAAEALGMGRNTLWRKLKKYGIATKNTNGSAVPSHVEHTVP